MKAAKTGVRVATGEMEAEAAADIVIDAGAPTEAVADTEGEPEGGPGVPEAVAGM